MADQSEQNNGKQRERDMMDPNLFGAAIAAAGEENYLGDAATVETMLRFSVATVLDRMQEIEDPETEKRMIRWHARQISNILLGYTKGWRPLWKWNTPGGIDVFCKKWCGIAETDPREVMEHSVLCLFLDIFEVVKYAGTPGIRDEQWQDLYDEIIAKYVYLFIGVDPQSQAMLEPVEL